MKNIFGLVVFASFSLSFNAYATLIYTDRTTFQDRLDALIIDDYSDPGYLVGDLDNAPTFHVHSNVHMSGIIGETRYTTTGFNFDVNIVSSLGTYCAGCNGSFLLDFTGTSVGDSSGVFGVGFDLQRNDFGIYSAFVQFGNGITQDFGLSTIPYRGMPEFWGITSDSKISSIHISNGGLPSYSGSVIIDNLTIGNAATVPEPATLALVGIGLAGIGYMRRKTA